MSDTFRDQLARLSNEDIERELYARGFLNESIIMLLCGRLIDVPDEEDYIGGTEEVENLESDVESLQGLLEDEKFLRKEVEKELAAAQELSSQRLEMAMASGKEVTRLREFVRRAAEELNYEPR